MAIMYVDQNCDAWGNVIGPYNISGSNDQLQVTIDGGSPITITLTHGAARTAAQVVADINGNGSFAAVATAYVSRGWVRMRTLSANGATSTIVIGAPSNNCNSTLGLGWDTLSHTGFSRVSTSFTNNNTKQNIINNMETILQGVGWVTITGSGTTNLLMQSRLTPPGENLIVRARFKDNGGSCVQVSVENYSGSVAGGNSTTAGGNLLPGTSKIYKVVANGYLFFVFTDPTTNAREFVAAGTLFLPTRLQGTISDLGWMQCNSNSDSLTTRRKSWRDASCPERGGNCPNTFQFVDGTSYEQSNSTKNPSAVIQQWAMLLASDITDIILTQWSDSSYPVSDALMMFGLAGDADRALIRGVLPDCFVVATALAGSTSYSDTPVTGKTSIVITDNNIGSSQTYAAGTLMMVTSG